MANIKQVAIISVLTVLTLVLGWFVVRDFLPHENGGVPHDAAGLVSGKDITSENDSSSVGNVEEVSPIPPSSQVGLFDTLDLNRGIPQPELNRQFIFPSRFSSEAVAILEKQFDTTIEKIRANPGSLEDWVGLASLYNIIDDFQRAAEVWNYLIQVTDNNTDARVNLGNLYHYQLKEYEQAEIYFREALSINPKLVSAYRGLFELYKYSYKTETSLAEDILKEGIGVIPETVDLRMLLASYYKEKGMSEMARTLYEEARLLAEKLGNTALIKMIDEELASFE